MQVLVYSSVQSATRNRSTRFDVPVALVLLPTLSTKELKEDLLSANHSYKIVFSLTIYLNRSNAIFNSID